MEEAVLQEAVGVVGVVGREQTRGDSLAVDLAAVEHAAVHSLGVDHVAAAAELAVLVDVVVGLVAVEAPVRGIEVEILEPEELAAAQIQGVSGPGVDLSRLARGDECDRVGR